MLTICLNVIILFSTRTLYNLDHTEPIDINIRNKKQCLGYANSEFKILDLDPAPDPTIFQEILKIKL